MTFRNKNLAKTAHAVILSLGVILQFVTFPIAHAATTLVPFNCDKITDKKATSGWVISILEENINNVTDKDARQKDENVMNCYRENDCTTIKEKDTNTTTCTAKIKATCTTVTPAADEPTPFHAISCQKVQVYFAQSGAELLYTYIGRVYRWAAGTVGIVAVFFLVLGGIEMSGAQGDSGKVEKAKDRITQSLSGLVLLFLSALILYTINPNFFTLS